ncbi:MAG: FAD-dependent oxidoreductase [Rhodocyclaceae bacterium]|nr:FAD-dependent oxidoreductase [Rhodocyclaceae bacterium]
MSGRDEDVVIVGAGRAGHALARAIRRRSQTSTITLIAAHSAEVYPKSAFPAALAANRDPITLVQATANMVAAREDLHLLEDSPVEAIDVAGGNVCMHHGSIPFDRLVVAVGEEIGVPPVLRGNPAIQPLNRISDFHLLHGRLRLARRVMILGAGVCACELANELVRSGREVIVVDSARHPLGERLPGLAGARLRDDLARAGVRFRLDDRVLAVDPISHGRFRVHTACNERIDVDAVVSLIEARPRTSLARASGIGFGHRGIDVDGFLRTSAEGIYAIGACASLPGLMRHASIEAQARALAETLCGRPAQPEIRPEPLRLNTPDARFVLFEPPVIAGEWQERATASGVSAAFVDLSGRLRGFALAGSAIEQRDAWMTRVALQS